MKKIYLIIPIKNPTKEFLKIIKFFSNKIRIIIVNDGSTINTHYFQKFNKKNISILINKKNMGKGYSIKKAFKKILKNGDASGSIVADGDGQHSKKDILKVYKMFCKNKNQVIIGQRKFELFNTPLRNFIGNKVSSFIVKIKYKQKIDTQCGLKAIPIDLMKKSLTITENDYAFETKFLTTLLYYK